MVKSDLTTNWKEVYNAVDQDRKVLFSVGAGGASDMSVYISFGRHKEEDVILDLGGGSALQFLVGAGTTVYAKTSESIAVMCVYRR